MFEMIFQVKQLLLRGQKLAHPFELCGQIIMKRLVEQLGWFRIELQKSSNI